MPLTRTQVREIDRLATERYSIPGIVLMENAAREAAAVAREMLGGDTTGSVLILCGGGNNGGDGLAVARHLHNHGIEVVIALANDPLKYQGDALINWNIVRAMNLQTVQAEPDALQRMTPRLVIDAIFGTGLSQPPREPFGKIVRAVEQIGAPVLAIDVPSGLDCDTGRPLGPCIRATRTITFVAEKIGFANPDARQWLGQTSVGDIGCPQELIRQVSEAAR